ncbi:hypothetical protein GmHk_20G057662 [Glycine max]|nr:hypothetical protein GmHk_20G057662 [Glycine max]
MPLINQRIVLSFRKGYISGDADEAPRRRRLTAFARRQWVAAPVAKDVEHVDHVADEVHDQPQEAVVDDVVIDAQGFPGEPHDTSILMDYERPELKLSSHQRKVEKFERPGLQIEGIAFFEYLTLVDQISIALGQCALEYTEWLYFISHPFMSPTQPRDPPRYPPVVHDDTFTKPGSPQQSVTTAAMPQPQPPTLANVDIPQNAVSCQAIAERLERLINLRVDTEGTKAYTVIEECLRISRGVTVQENVYVRSRRKRHML